MYVYVDMFLGLNLVLNTLLLILTANLCGAPVQWRRIVLAAAWGGVYALGAVCLEWGLAFSIPLKLLVSLVMIQIAFHPSTVKSMLQFTAAYYLACFITGGAITGWYYYRQSFVSALSLPIGTFLVWKDILIGGMLALCLLIVVKSGFFSNIFRKSIEYQVEVLYRERVARFTAILDTGNSLYSASRVPVIVAELQTIQGLLSEEAKAFFLQKAPIEWLENIYLCRDKELLARLQIIPFRHLGGENVLIGFRPDIVRVHVKGSTIETSKVIIGVYAGSLSAQNRYTALLHPAILQGSVHKEVKACVSLG